MYSAGLQQTICNIYVQDMGAAAADQLLLRVLKLLKCVPRSSDKNWVSIYDVMMMGSALVLLSVDILSTGNNVS